ncbi:FMN-binding protein [Streptomyces nigrescens]|uniref:FMN-binding protein n=2 Tax=Streptomyces TaxID=1883 RepID=A0ABN6QVR9_STRNI|nr:FMN-binding protein [Streptomyces nigrescens]MEE4418309.1 FMN-binding protein [Streptomyces sp. DSM 41528]BDM69345.1 FMN-binding protein [Streptomyces nigrescens]
MRRAVLTAASTSALVVLLLSLKPHQPAALTGDPAQAGAASAPTPSGRPSQGSHPADGTYTGAPIRTRYGTVQVTATVKAGRLTAVKVLHAPSENGRDREIAAYALPRLTQEALSAHSAHIDAVSGASYTSAGYVQSLQSALDRAGV